MVNNVEKFQTCKVYQYRNPVDINRVINKFENYTNEVYIGTSKKQIPIKLDDTNSEELIYSVQTEKSTKINEKTYKTFEMHKIAISTKHKLMVVFRPQQTEFLPKLFSLIIMSAARPKLFYELHYKKEQIEKFVDAIIDNETQMVDPRFYFNRSLFNEMSYIKFSAGDYACATTISDYKKALEVCTILEPIFRFKNIDGLVDKPLEEYRLLQINSDMKFRSVWNPISVENWLEFIYKYVDTYLIDHTNSK